MYVPGHNQETRPEVLRSIMENNRLATLVAQTADGLVANHIPLEYDPAVPPNGLLRGHIARANSLWREELLGEVLAIFCGPSSYVSPTWYGAKQISGEVVPTWNYAVVHLYGKATFIHDPGWLRKCVAGLTSRHESGRQQPWTIEDAPAEFVEKQLRAIVGLEISVSRIIGKLKLSQNRCVEDQVGVAEALKNEGSMQAREMAALMKKQTGR